MLTLDRRFLLMTVAAGLPAVIIALVLLWTGRYPLPIKWALSAFTVALWLGCTYVLRERIARPLRTISSMVAALRENDFSIRARGAGTRDPLSAVLYEVNLLADTMRTQRLDAQEATALLRAVMAEIDVAIFAFDGGQRLVLVNGFGERLLAQPADTLIGRTADALGLVAALDADTHIKDLRFPGASARWEIRRRKFWQGGQAHEMLVLADVSLPLREQERQAWQRLIRVIGHELNNSLAPIKSIAGSLASLMAHPAPPEDWRDDMQRGLTIIGSRADALGRFTTAYAQLARLPAPERRPVSWATLMRRVAGLETRLPVNLVEGPDVTVNVDSDQLEQLLINIVRNAVDAAVETGGGVTITWDATDDELQVRVDDEGPGLQSTANLFVPFFTTKPGGSGIGLALSRQIAEQHQGSLNLHNRAGARGTRATLTLPL
ncbi:MAG TPA: ATP-binding protein [Vicinamibacterales bacterium]|nr:ATP-binding protein [Vicinamibacterales bacterium]